MADRQKLNRREREALNRLLRLCDTALANLRQPLIFANNHDMVGSVRTRSGNDVLREAAEILGPLCGIGVRKEAAHG